MSSKPNRVVLCLGALVGALAANPASAVLEYYDSFNYSAGQLTTVSSPTWTEHSTGGTTNKVQVVATASDSGNSLSYAGLATSAGNRATAQAISSGEDIGRTFASPYSSNSVYASFLIKATGPASVGGGYFAHFLDSPAGLNFRGKLFMRDSGGTGFQVGASISANTADGYSAGVFPYGTTHLVVIKYTIVAGAGNDITAIFVNPTPGGSEPAANITTSVAGTDAADIERFCLRQDASYTSGFQFDELRVGTSWSDVTPAAATAPEISAEDSLNTAINSGGSFNFGAITSGGGDDTEVFEIHNTGTAALTISSVNFTGTAFSQGGDTLAASISAGASDTFSVVFDDGAGVGPQSGSVTINNNDSDEPAYLINLSGSISAPAAPEVSVENSANANIPNVTGSFDFGTHLQDSPDVTEVFEVHNTGTATLNTSGLAIFGVGFNGGSDSLSPTIAPGASDTFDVVFETGNNPGPFSGSVTFTTNDSDENPFTFPISGTLVSPEINVENSANTTIPNGGNFTFANITAGGANGSETFEVHNVGSSTLNISSVDVLGSAGFVAGSNPLASSIAAGSSDTFDVIFDSTGGVGPHSATITINSDDLSEPAYVINVDGNIDAGNTDPFVTANFNTFVNEGDTETIAQSDLEMSDTEQGAASITYTLTAVPTSGTLLNGVTPLSVSSTFTQANINASNISYQHNGTESSATDSFSFTYTDGIGTAQGPETHSLNVLFSNDNPTIDGSADLAFNVNAGQSYTLTNVDLNILDEEQAAALLFYRIDATPTAGTLNDAARAPLTVGSTFTQAELNGGDITYQNSGGPSPTDSFTVSISDGAIPSPISPTVVNITINASSVSDWAILDNE